MKMKNNVIVEQKRLLENFQSDEALSVDLKLHCLNLIAQDRLGFAGLPWLSTTLCEYSSERPIPLNHATKVFIDKVIKVL